MRFQSLIIVLTFRRWLATGLVFFCLPFAMADSSSITEAEGYSCMGVDYSRKETENLALQDAKRKAVEFSSSVLPDNHGFSQIGCVCERFRNELGIHSQFGG